ncbi:MAG: glycosyltransferase [Candidatus Eisenbacteria bacterium]|nr:glycosyltransferase [Candidatus Latescibacterota bacterium]MBD3301103.1 glycosyltransferase [Candidatus Eisenbacteria bacterium]
MKIAIASSEMVPFMKVGGLADVIGALAKELVRQGHDVRVLLPRPGPGSGPNRKTEPVGEVAIPMRSGIERAGIERVRSGPAGPEILFVHNDRYFDRPNPYVDPATGRPWPDSAQRTIFFCKAIVETLRSLEPGVEVLHLNDHQTGLVPVLMREVFRDETGLRRIGILFAIHNLGYQGVYEPEEVLPEIADPATERLSRAGGPLEFYGKVNFMKAAILYADLIVTVSERYALEIQHDPEHGFGLEGVLRTRAEHLVGILNGIDPEIWDPETDPLIPSNYTATDLGSKRDNKERLLQAVELPVELDVPVIGMISRLVGQKGFDLLEDAVEEMMDLPLKLVILGSGDPRYEALLRGLREKHPDRIGVSLTFNDPLAHLIEAGSDFFLMPSRYEPCGLNQMYSLRYGTIPIVRTTGGLADTIREFDVATGRGNGFVFGPYEPGAMLGAIRRGLAVYEKRRAWKKLVSTVMRIDHSWARAAAEYVRAYRRAAGARR